MLTVAKITQGAAAGYGDYLRGRAEPGQLGDYYLKDGERVEAPGRWTAGAASVGAVAGARVSEEQLRALMAVRRPDTGAALRPVGANGQAVAALDATFSAPKSVSAVWAVSSAEQRQRIEAVHELAIDRALGYAIQEVAMIRSRLDAKSVIHRRAVELVATSWLHTTARAVDGAPPDPQLHSHVLLHGAVREDGRVMAIDSRMWLMHARELGAAYRSELARELAGLGYRIVRGTGRGRRYFEIDGVPQPLIDSWSSRHRQVREAIDARLDDHEARLIDQITAGGEQSADAAQRLERLRRSRQLAPKQDRSLTVLTRAGKRQPPANRDLDHHWRRPPGISACPQPRPGRCAGRRSHRSPPRRATS